MAPHSSTLAWKSPWTEEPGRLQSIGSLQVGHDWATSLSHIGEGNSNPLQCSCRENPRDGGAWWAAIYGVAQGRSRLRWLSSSSNTIHCVQVHRKNYKTYKRVENTVLILRDQVSNTARFWYSWYVRIIRLWKFKTTMINIRTPIK